MKYILWDWNGTLLDDTQAALDTLNAMLTRRGEKSIAMDFYRDHFAFPCRPFYEQIGMRVSERRVGRAVGPGVGALSEQSRERGFGIAIGCAMGSA